MNNTILPGKYLVSGSSGLIGTSVLNLLKNKPGISVVGIYFKSEPRIHADNIEHVKLDLRQRGRCEHVLRGVDYVIHLASNIVTKSFRGPEVVDKVTSNTSMNMNFLESVYHSNVKKMLWISSSTGYPLSESILHEKDMFISDPGDSYFAVGWSNRFIEKILETYSLKMSRKLSTVILRPTCVYGEHQIFELLFLPYLVRSIMDNGFVELWDDGESKRDFLHADDIADMCVMAMSHSKQFDILNVGYGVSYSTNYLISEIGRLSKIENIEVVRNYKVSQSVRQLSTEKLKEVLRFKPKVNIEEGISRMIAQYKKERR